MKPATSITKVCRLLSAFRAYRSMGPEADPVNGEETQLLGPSGSARALLRVGVARPRRIGVDITYLSESATKCRNEVNSL